MTFDDPLPQPPSGPIVVGIDDSPSSAGALRWAAEEAARSEVPLRIVHVWSIPPVAVAAPMMAPAYVDPQPFAMRADHVVARAVDVVGELLGEAAPSLSTHVVQGFASEVLLAEAADAHMLVLGTHDRGALGRAVHGSVVERCLRDAPVPVVVVRPQDVPPADGDVVVGLDDSAGGRAALCWGAEEAGRRGARLVVVHARPHDDDPAGTAALEADAKRFVDRAVSTLPDSAARPTTIAWRIVSIDADEALVRSSLGAALLVVGARADLSAVERVLGSVSRRCVHGATCPVAVLTSEGQRVACAS